jgi:hypothetical protein
LPACAAGHFHQHVIYLVLASLFVYAMHVLKSINSAVKPAGLIGSFREETYLRHKKIFLYTSLTSIVVAHDSGLQYVIG